MFPEQASDMKPGAGCEELPGKSAQVKRGRKRKRKTSVEQVVPAAQLNGNAEYEVEDILSHSAESDPTSTSPYQKLLYKVKWAGYSEEESTWESLSNLKNSLLLIVKYFERLNQLNLTVPSQEEEFRRSLMEEITPSELEKVANKHSTMDKCLLDIDEEELESQIRLFSRLPRMARDPKVLKELKNDLLLLQFKKAREKQLSNLKLWEAEMNSQALAPVKVENEIDLSWRPLDFVYTEHNVYSPLINKECLVAITGCECHDCQRCKCDCATRDGVSKGYNSSQKLKTEKGMAIYECTKLCKCGPSCVNRVLQKGRTVPLTVFKTPDRGWGVKSQVPINKGQFVVEYVGEVITKAEADKRERLYSREGKTYLFDLDFSEEEAMYTIDAIEYGNVSHFINHSCNPNLVVRAVYVDCIDANFPRLGLYATRHISIDDELTFDYLCLPVDKSEKRFLDARVMCKCNSKNCRKYLY